MNGEDVKEHKDGVPEVAAPVDDELRRLRELIGHAITHGNFRFAEGHHRARGENIAADLNSGYATAALHAMQGTCGVQGMDPLGQPGVDDGGPYNGLVPAGVMVEGGSDGR